MSRIFVMGHELPGMAEGTIEARSYRTWQFVEPLLENGHEVCLIASHEKNELNVAQGISPSLTYHRLNFQDMRWLRQVNAISEQFKADAVLGVMFNNGLRATRLANKRPLWVDLYGDRLAENQIAAHTRRSNRGLEISLEYLKLISQYADKYSTCSTPQKFAMVGELGMASRLNRHTMGYEFIHPILPGASSKQEDSPPELIVRGNPVPNDAFVVLWAGGYNVWTDMDTLFHALDRAMGKDPRIHYVSAGAGVRLSNNNSYERFLEMISTSSYRDRFHMLGWQPSTVVPGLYKQADVGVNLDAFHYETELGTRTRLVEMMHYGLPVISTLGCELSYIVENQGLGLTFPIGDAKSFAKHILTLSGDRALQQKLGARAKDYTDHQLSFQTTTRLFQEWAKNPVYAPDRMRERSGFDFEELSNNLRAKARSLIWRFWALERGD